MNEIDMKLNPNLIPAVAVVVVASAAAAPPAPVIQASSVTVTEAPIEAVLPPLPKFSDSELDEWKAVFDADTLVQYNAKGTNANKMMSMKDYQRVLDIVSNTSHDKYDSYKNEYHKREFETTMTIGDEIITRRKTSLFRNPGKGKKGKKLKSGETNPRKEYLGREVVPIERYFEVITKVHAECAHSGMNSTWNAVKERYYGIQQNVVSRYCAMCGVCAGKNRQPQQKKIQPIVSMIFGERVQMDLIDFSRLASGEFKYILTIKDHFTRRTILRPLKSKSCAEIAYWFEQYICDWGKPRILHTDNGMEFCGPEMIALCAKWNIKVVHGRPRHSNVQGSVECMNKIVQESMFKHHAAMKINIHQWKDQLGFIQHAINARECRSIRMSPYKCIFKREPWLPSDLVSMEEYQDLDMMTNEEVVCEQNEIEMEFNKFYDELIKSDETSERSTLIENIPGLSLVSVSQQNVNNEMVVESDSLAIQSNDSLKIRIRKNRIKRKIEEKKNDDMSIDEIAQRAASRMRDEIAGGTRSKRNKNLKYKIGELVGILREEKYRHAHTERMAPAKIINVLPNDMYQLMTEYGILNRNQPASALGYISPMYIKDRIDKIDANINYN